MELRTRATFDPPDRVRVPHVLHRPEASPPALVALDHRSLSVPVESDFFVRSVRDTDPDDAAQVVDWVTAWGPVHLPASVRLAPSGPFDDGRTHHDALRVAARLHLLGMHFEHPSSTERRMPVRAAGWGIALLKTLADLAYHVGRLGHPATDDHFEAFADATGAAWHGVGVDPGSPTPETGRRSLRTFVALINEMCGGTAPLPGFVLHDDPSPVPDEPPACGTAAARQIASLHARDVRVRDCLNCGGRFSIKSGRATRTTRGRKDADHCSPSCANAYSSRRSYHAAKAGADPSVAQQRP